MELKDLKIGQSLVVAITFNEYKKIHPKTQKKASDPLFKGLPHKKFIDPDTARDPKQIEKEHKKAVEDHLDNAAYYKRKSLQFEKDPESKKMSPEAYEKISKQFSDKEKYHKNKARQHADR